MDDQSYEIDDAVDEIAQTIATQREAISMLRTAATEAIENEDVREITSYLQLSIELVEGLLDQAADAKAILATLAVKRGRERS